MPIPVPQLDDRTFQNLVQEGLALIPRYSQAWTDHNLSDPGIMLLELFAWLTETALYQLDRVPEASVENFLRLIGISREVQNGHKEDLEAVIRRALQALEERHHAVTAAEFEALAMQAAPPEEPVARAKYLRVVDELCVHPHPHPGEPPVMALIIIVPDDRESDSPTPSQALTDTIFGALKQRCLLTTRLHVIGPEYVEIRIQATAVRQAGSGLTAEQVQAAIGRFFHPLAGGPEGKGWSFGRWVYRSELYQLIEGLPYVDHVESLRLELISPNGIPHQEGAEVIEIEIPPSALIYLTRDNRDFVQVVDMR
jgi:hypothetical protein